MVSEGLVDVPRAQGQWALAWRRMQRDRLAVACGLFLLLALFAVGPGAPLYGKLVGHGPNDFFPYAVSVGLRPAGPLTATWATPRLVVLNLVADLVVLALDPAVARRGRDTTRLAGRAA